MGEEIAPKQKHVLLTGVDNCAPEHDIDYIGTSFGVTLELYNFWQKKGFQPVYIRQAVQNTTGEHSLIMLRPTKKADSRIDINNFVQDFRRRLTRTASGAFQQMNTTLCLALLGGVEASDPNRTLTLETLLEYFTRHDLERFEKYATNRADISLITDLIPQVALFYFQRRISITPSLTPIQAVTLLALGVQNHSVERVATELGVDPTKIRSLFLKAMKRTWDFFYELLSTEVAGEVAQGEDIREVGKDAVITTLAEEQRKLGKEFKEGLRIHLKRDQKDVDEELKRKKKNRKLHH